MYGQQQGQNQAQIPFSKKKELEAMVAQGKIDMAAGKITDWELAKKLQEAAMGVESSQSMEALKDIRYGQPEQAGGGGMPIEELERLEAERALTQEQNARVQNGPPGMQREIMTPGYNNSPAGGMPTTQLPLKTPLDDYPAGGFPIETVTNNMPAPGSHGFQLPPERGQPNTPQGILPRIVPERPTLGSTMNAMGGGLMDAGRSIGGGLSSMGRSLGAGAKSLFNDPSRMAMLQGGLSMMDPNTYYDKQGFGSVFTGLNKGLGAAQQGHAGVLARRKAVADTAKAKAEAAYARGGKAGKNKAEFERVLEEYLTLPDGSARKPMLKRRLDTLAPEPGTGGVDYNYREKAGYTWDKLVPKSDEMQTSLTNFTNLINSTVDSPLGITFGPGTDFKAHAYAVLSETFGQDMGEEGERLANTRKFMSAMGAQVADAITAFGAGTGLSDADREFAKQMVGANPGDFTEASLRKLLIYNEGAMRGKLVAHNQRLKEMYGGTPPAGTLRKLPAMSKNLKRHMVEQMRKGDYTIGGEDVDPNKKPEGWTDEYPDQWKLLALKSAKKTAGNPTENRITKVNNG